MGQVGTHRAIVVDEQVVEFVVALCHWLSSVGCSACERHELQLSGLALGLKTGQCMPDMQIQYEQLPRFMHGGRPVVAQQHSPPRTGSSISCSKADANITITNCQPKNSALIGITTQAGTPSTIAMVAHACQNMAAR
jgi:hypothetical protein